MSFQKASSIKVPDIFFQTKKTGQPEIDKTFSDTSGVVPSQVVFATGKPGAGKTSLAIVIGTKLALVTKRPAAFVSLEMSDFQLANSAKKIPGFKELVMVETEFSIEKLKKDLRQMKPCIVIVDSIQKAAKLLLKQKEAVNLNQAQQFIVDELYKFAKETFIPFILIGHMTKSGSYLGPAGLEHEVDSHLHVDYDQELDLRTFYFGKNRFGGSIDPQLFGISSEGIWIGTPYDIAMDMAQKPEAETVTDLSTAASRMRSVIEQFAQRNLGKPAIGMTEIQLCGKEMIEYLKIFDRTNIVNNSFIKDPNRVKLTFKHKGVAHCISRTGEIQLGDVMGMSKFGIGPQTMPGGIVYTVGYKKEQPFIMRNCRTREDLFEWVVLHEWVHLYKGMQNHHVVFFQTVEALWKRYKASLVPIPFANQQNAIAAEIETTI